MTDREQNRRKNESLQSGEGAPAFGQDAREFGAGRQVTQDPLSGNDAPKRRLNRDPKVREGALVKGRR
jgi:hypothetical protein